MSGKSNPMNVNFEILEIALINQAKENCDDSVQLEKYIEHVKQSIIKLKKGDIGKTDYENTF